ncbi:MAG: isoleucine--tRNA ligase [bacterium]|nr:isoleucine--tRNA ligase [bacterium]MDZ4296525.1 isoleucine--tRNA ligase [Patescibacteria group bacterium]
MDLLKNEEKTLEYWARKKIFERSVAQRKGKRHFVFYDGPPFATGRPHYGHILTSVIKDAVLRFQTMRGRHVERRWGWDCHGLPLENLVEQELKLKTKRDIEAYGIDKFNRYAQDAVLRYADEWAGVIPRIGRWVDMDRPYRTMDWQYSETIWWIFKTLYERRLIYEGYKSMHVCPRCQTPLANFEVTLGYKEIKDSSVIAKFELVDEPNTFLLAWTTTPWTLPGNVALAVRPVLDYLKIKITEGADAGVTYIVAQGRAAESGIGTKFGIGKRLDGQELKSKATVSTIKSEDLVGKRYKPLFDYYANDPNLTNRENGWKVYGADFVSTEEGTGIVHIAPAFGEDDMLLGQKEKLPFIQHVAMDGALKPEVRDFAGLPAKPKGDHRATDKKIIAYLQEQGSVFQEQEIEHAYPHCWRCDTPLLNYATTSWFVNVAAIRDKLIANNKKVQWLPLHIRDGRFGKWLYNARDWAISRSRYWGAPLPVWRCAACKAEVVIGSIGELWRRSGGKGVAPKGKFLRDDRGEVNLHRPYIDMITLPCACGGTMRRILEVFDCWFESGSMPFGQHHYMGVPLKHFDPKKNVGFPADFIDEGLDQTRGWFYSLLVVATALFGKAPYRHVNVHGTILAEDGQKMSKRLKNYPDPLEVVGKFGADAMRLYLLSAPVVHGEDLNFSLKGVDEVYKRYSLIAANVLNFYELYKPLLKKRLPGRMRLSILDRWIHSRLQGAAAAVTQALDRYEIVAATRPLMDFLDDLSLWYVRRSRERVKAEGADAHAALETLGSVIHDFARLSAPVTPFLAETLYQGAGRGRRRSVHLQDWPKVTKRLIDKELEAQMAAARQVVSEALRLRAEAQIRVRQPLAELRIKSQALRGKKELLELIADEVNVKAVRIDPKMSESVSLETTLTEALREEGFARELIRAIQNLRKARNLKPQQRVAASVYGIDADFWGRWKAAVERETHTTVHTEDMGRSLKGGAAIAINDKAVTIAL